MAVAEAIASAATALALSDGPANASYWADLTSPREECFCTRQGGVRLMDFSRPSAPNISALLAAMTTILVRCEPDKSVVLFLAASRKRANALQLNLQCNYLMGPLGA